MSLRKILNSLETNDIVISVGTDLQNLILLGLCQEKQVAQFVAALNDIVIYIYIYRQYIHS